jgi:hypothetical protein
MLEGLDTASWDALHHAFGAAGNVPQMLRDVASNDAAIRNRAWEAVYTSLCHQGTVYEATAHAVPFLIDLARERQVPDRHYILACLSAFAQGHSAITEHECVDIFRYVREAPDFDQQLARALASVRAARQAVRAGAPYYAELLGDPAPLVRAGAAYLLAHFPEDAARHIGWITVHVASGEPDPVARTACVYSVGVLAARHAESEAWLEAMLAGDDVYAVRVAAALGLAWMGPDIPQAARAVIAEAALGPAAATIVFKQLPWAEPDLATCCNVALAVIGGETRMEPEYGTVELANALDDITPFRASDVARALLQFVFAGRALPAATMAGALSEDQHYALSAIVYSRKFWAALADETVATAAMNVLHDFGLPASPAAIAEFLRREWNARRAGSSAI